jgi:hypothetical protein
MEIFTAATQWATRPADERFTSLQELYTVTHAYAHQASQKTVSWDSLRVEARDEEIQLIDKADVPARFTHWAFGQLCGHVNAPVSYLRSLPSTLACQNLNHGLANRSLQPGNPAQMMFHDNGSLLLRALTTEAYQRIWNWEIVERLLEWEQKGWEPARPDLRWDGGDPTVCLRCNGTGDDGSRTEGSAEKAMPYCIACKGTGHALPALYASDKDMFAFVRNRKTKPQRTGNRCPVTTWTHHQELRGWRRGAFRNAVSVPRYVW